MTTLAARAAVSRARARARTRRGAKLLGATLTKFDSFVRFSMGEIAYNDLAAGADAWREI